MIDKVMQELKNAVDNEVEGYQFYLAAADFVKDEKGRDLFKQLAKDELDHLKALKSLSITLEKEGKWVTYEEAVNNDILTREEEMIHFFPDKDLIPKLLGTEPTEVDALNFGIKIEKEAVEYYSRALEKSKDKDEVSFYTSMVNIEGAHLNLLRWEYDSVTRAGFWCDFQEYTVEGEK